MSGDEPLKHNLIFESIDGSNEVIIDGLAEDWFYISDCFMNIIATKSSDGSLFPYKIKGVVKMSHRDYHNRRRRIVIIRDPSYSEAQW